MNCTAPRSNQTPLSGSPTADAEAIAEAVSRLTMRFVAVKSTEQQAVLLLRRTRVLLTSQSTTQVTALRAYVAELGATAAQGISGGRGECPPAGAAHIARRDGSTAVVKTRPGTYANLPWAA